jgi:hypothetical protein
MQRHALPCPHMLGVSFKHVVTTLVDSSTGSCLPPKTACNDWMVADAVAVQKIPGRVLETCAQPLAGGGAGQRGRRNEGTQSRRSVNITSANVDWQRASTFISFHLLCASRDNDNATPSTAACSAVSSPAEHANSGHTLMILLSLLLGA